MRLGRFHQTEKCDGKSYVFETDFVLIGGKEWRANDNNLFLLYLALNESNSLFYGGASGAIKIVDGEYVLSFAGVDSEGNTFEKPIETSKWYNFRIEIEGLSTGSLVKYYLNGELVHSARITKGASSVSHVVLRFNLETTGQMYLDNTYFSATGEIVEAP